MIKLEFNIVSLSASATQGGRFLHKLCTAAGRWITPMAFFMSIYQMNSFSGLYNGWGYLGAY